MINVIEVMQPTKVHPHKNKRDTQPTDSDGKGEERWTCKDQEKTHINDAAGRQAGRSTGLRRQM